MTQARCAYNQARRKWKTLSDDDDVDDGDNKKDHGQDNGEVEQCFFDTTPCFIDARVAATKEAAQAAPFGLHKD